MERRREESRRAGLEPEVRFVALSDEREPIALEALDLIRNTFPRQDRHSIAELRSEVEEKRLRLLTPFGFHLVAMIDQQDHVASVGIGVYLAGVNAGFVDYLAVREDYRRKRLGNVLREHLVEAFRADAVANGFDELDWVLGEVRLDNPWLLRLVRSRGAIPFDLTYYHPGMAPGETEDRYILYREPHGDQREVLPTEEVRRILYAIYRRAYRVRYPLMRDNFRAMMDEIDGRETIGPHPEVMRSAGS